MKKKHNPNIVYSNIVFDKSKSKLYFFEFPNYIQVISGYPKWSAYFKKANSGIWQRFRPEIDVMKNIFYRKSYPYRFKEKYFEYYDRQFERKYTRQLRIPFEGKEEYIMEYPEFFNLIPKKIRDAASKFLFRQWSIISACKSVPEFPDLIISNPALAFALANCWVYNKNIKSGRQISYIKRHIHKKQRYLLKYIGFPEEETYVKLLRKIDPVNISAVSLLKFRENLLSSKHSRRIKTVSEHLKKINPVLFKIFSDTNVLKILSNRDLIKLSEKNYHIYDDYFYIRKILYYYKLIFGSAPTVLPVDILKEYSNELESTYNLKPDRDKNLNLPEPPFSFNRYIRPLRTVSDIIEWADGQKNCITDYIYSIYFRRSFLYCVEYENETATFEILIDNSTYKLGNILGIENKPVSKNLSSMVTQWFINKTRGIMRYKYYRAS